MGSAYNEARDELFHKIRRERDAIEYCEKRAQDWTAQAEAHEIELARLEAGRDLLYAAEAERKIKRARDKPDLRGPA